MRRLLLLPTLLLLLVPSAAVADGPSFKVSVSGTVNEQWRVDRAPNPACGEVQASGSAAMRFATPKPKRVSFNIDSGFRSKPLANVTVDRRGTVAFHGERDCYYLPATSGCGVRSYKTRVELNYGRRFYPQLDEDDSSLFGRVCPMADLFDGPTVSDDPMDREYFSTARMLMLGGLKIEKLRQKIATCRRLPCRHKRTNVMRFRKQYTAPYLFDRQPYGQYTATVDWQVKFVRTGRIRMMR